MRVAFALVLAASQGACSQAAVENIHVPDLAMPVSSMPDLAMPDLGPSVPERSAELPPQYPDVKTAFPHYCAGVNFEWCRSLHLATAVAVQRYCASVTDPELLRGCALFAGRLGAGQELDDHTRPLPDNGESDGYSVCDKDPSDPAYEFCIEISDRGVGNLFRFHDDSRRAIGRCGSPRRAGLKHALARYCAGVSGRRDKTRCADLRKVLNRCDGWLPAWPLPEPNVTVTIPDPAQEDIPGRDDLNCNVEFAPVGDPAAEKWRVANFDGPYGEAH